MVSFRYIESSHTRRGHATSVRPGDKETAMRSRERLVLLTLLGLTVGVNLFTLLGRTGSPAVASNEGFRLDDLGPADRLLLRGERELAVRNADGRMAWSDNEHGRAYSMAFVDVNDVLVKLMETDGYKNDREKLTETVQAEEKEWLAKRDALQGKYGNITPDDPRMEQARAEFGAWQAGVQQWQQDAQNRVNTMAIEQLKKAYAEIVTAVDVVADKRGIDIVFRFTPGDEPLTEGISGQTMLDIRLRPVVRAPKGLDITVDVLEEMSLPVE